MERYHEKKNDYYIFKYKHIATVLLCSTVLDIITGNSRCIYPNCTERATYDSAYCSYHKPYYLK